MAVTKFHAIKTGLTKPLEYILNEEKTQEGLLVSGFRCNPETANNDFMFARAYVNSNSMDKSKIGGSDILGYHMIQSFAPWDNVTPEEAHRIGEEWAREVTGGNHQFVLATHVDKGQLHNHVIFNSYSVDTMKKFRSQPYKTAQRFREISDRLCVENGLSVIENPKGKGKSYKEWQSRKNGASWKAALEQNIERAIQDTGAGSFSDFRANLQGLGVEMEQRGKYLRYRLEGQERWSRANGRSLPQAYSFEGIQERLIGSGRELHYITLNKNLVKSGNDTYQSYWTKVPYSKEYVWIDYTHAAWYKGDTTLSAFIDPDKSYMLYGWNGLESREIKGSELARYYQSRGQEKETAPERLERPTEAREGQQREVTPASPKRARLRGAAASLRGVPLPLDRRAAIELRKYQTADIQAMAGALLTMRREGIQSYSGLDRRIGEYRRERDALNGRMDSITKEMDGIAGTLGAMEIYNTHLQYREAVEKAGVFRKKKVEQQYRLKLQALAGSEKELQRLGIDPASVTPETPERQRGRIEALRREKMGLQDQRQGIVDRRTAVMKSKEQMDRLFVYKNIDREGFRSRYMEMDMGGKDSALQEFLNEQQKKADLYNSQLPDRDPSRSRGLDR